MILLIRNKLVSYLDYTQNFFFLFVYYCHNELDSNDEQMQQVKGDVVNSDLPMCIIKELGQ